MSMNITITRRDILQLLTACEKASDTRSALPALSHVLLSVEGDKLRLSATDLYLSMTGVRSCEVHTEGSVAVPAREFRERIKAMPDGDVRVTATAGGEVTIAAVGAARRFKLHGLPGEDFPAIRKPSEGSSFAISTKALAELLTRTRFAASTDETRPQVNSLLLELEPELAVAVATDGHRLSLARSTEVPADLPKLKLLISLKSVNELAGLIGTDDAKEIGLSVEDGWLFCEVSGIQMGTKLIDAQFPPYMQVIPKKSDVTISVARRDLADSLKAMQVATSDKTGGVKLTLGDNALKITASAPDAGEGVDEVETECKPSKTTYGLNAKYVLDIFGAINDHRVELGLSGELDPVVVRIPEDDSFVAVVMPMRVQ